MIASGNIHPRALLLMLIAFMPLVILLSLQTGEVSVVLADLWQTESVAHQVFMGLRFPRLCLTLLAGALLGITGAAVQAMFRNPLADPSLIGVSAGAGLAAVAMLVFGGAFIAYMGDFALPLAAFLGGLLATWLVSRIARRVDAVSVTTMLLVGIAINATAASGISALKYFSDDFSLRQVVFWLMGGLQHQGWSEVVVLALIALPVFLGLLSQSRTLNLLLLGERQAQLLGVSVQRCHRYLIVFCALGVGAVVAVGGMIGFVGLVVPHLVRLMIGPDNRYLLPLSALLGALFLTLADVLARLLIAPAELPLGVVTSLLGGPFFLLMILYRRGGMQ
ncbi:MAG: FecCD family ABC transporter permease [Pontibacterium sp.]